MKRSELFFAFILVPVDIAMIIISFVIAYYVRADMEAISSFWNIGLKEYLRYSIYLIPAWIALFALHGLYNIRAARGFWAEIFKIFNASSIAILFLIVGIFLSKSLFFSRLILVFTWIISIIMISLGRFIVQLIQKYLLQFGVGRRKILLIGDNSTSVNIMDFISSHQNSGYKVCGVLSSDSEQSKHGLKVIGKIGELKDKIYCYEIDEIILTDIAVSKSKIIEIIQICSDYNVIFKYIPDTFSLMTFNVSSGLLGSMPVMELKPIPLDGWGRIIKRIIDFSFALFWIIVLSPVFVLIMLLQLITSRGPIFFSHDRIGRDGKKFSCHKFRSMYIDKCDFTKGGSKWTTQKDELVRITPLGRILRKTNLDELPQLWNIFVGEMSFVGPRPEQPKLVKRFENEIPEYFRRRRVKAGLTGWAQVNGLKGDTSIKERVRYDLFYIENWSLWFDIKILFKTLALVVYETFSGKYEYRSRS
ncbi:MAG: undecaprenyl-phosphate glucose phosphotransferase [Patescibacteria group bacterium]|nr:undecaprenyl-phosphate glucose phosphotransferase [Patescibacteria group bacterium]